MTLDLTRWEKPDLGALFVVSGPSGSGKTTLVRHALSVIPHVGFSVSATTRAMRPGERDSVDYQFLSRTDFDARLARGEFLEWAEVYGNRYGTPRAPVEEALSRGDSILLDIDTQGAAQVRERFPEAVTLFVLPPSVTALEARLRGRSTDAEAIIARRVHEAHVQLQECHLFQHLVVNDHLPAALDQFQAILVTHLLARSRREGWVRKIREEISSKADCR